MTFSRKTWIYFLKKKDEVFQLIQGVQSPYKELDREKY